MQTFHGNKKEILKIMQLPKNSKARREAFVLLRNQIKFDLYIEGDVRPVRSQNIKGFNFYPCVHCQGVFKKSYLKRHARHCKQNQNKGARSNYVSESQTLTACLMDSTNAISKLNVKEKVFDKMKGDAISFEAKKIY